MQRIRQLARLSATILAVRRRPSLHSTRRIHSSSLWRTPTAAGSGGDDNSIGTLSNEAVRKFLLSFKCKPCGERMSRLISRQAYESGVVIVRCESCSRLHLIADNLGWFPDLLHGKATRNIEQILAERGESVVKSIGELIASKSDLASHMLELPSDLMPPHGEQSED